MLKARAFRKEKKGILMCAILGYENVSFYLNLKLKPLKERSCDVFLHLSKTILYQNLHNSCRLEVKIW